MDTEPTRAELRRLQIVNAAVRCFEEQGFHATSMARIAETAGMSVGHIYHYFPGKEALIDAVVEVKLDEAFERMNAAARERNLLRALVIPTDDKTRKLREHVLILDVLAEGSRNARIAEMMRRADDRLMQRQREIFRELRPDIATLSDAEVQNRLELFNGLIVGLMTRALANPDRYGPGMKEAVEKQLLALITT